MFTLIPSLLVFLLIFWRFIYPLQSTRLTKLLFSMVILVMLSKYAIYYFLAGDFFNPALPKSLLFITESLMGSVLILLFMIILRDVILIIFKIFKRPFSWHKQTKNAVLFFITALILGFYSGVSAISVPNIRHVDLTFKNLPPDLNGFKIIQITDTHIHKLLNKAWLAEVVARANAQNPDLILLTGDYVDAPVAQLESEVAPFYDLRARYGVFGVTGNHEYYAGAMEWLNFFKKTPIQMLDNEHRVLNINQAKLAIIGTPDPSQGRFGGTKPDIHQALKNIEPKTFKILLAHQPRGAVNNALAGIDLQLSGHTHGGLMFFLQPIVAAFNDGFVAGHYNVSTENSQTMQLYVSRGTGLWSGFSVRFFVPSEITLLTLHAER